MKPVILACLLSFCFYHTYAQISRNTAILAQWVDAQPLRGLKIKVQGAVRVKALDSAAWACIWVRVDDMNGKMAYLYNMNEGRVRKQEWAMYTSPEIKIDKHARGILLGGYSNSRGIFYFDDFHLLVQKTDGGPWEDMPLKEGGLEGDTANINKAWHYHNNYSTVVWTLRDDPAWQGRQCLVADASHMYEFDNNDSAGRYVDVNGIRMYYEEYGQGAPLLLLHGNRGSIADFKKQIPILSRNYHVIAVDTRGQGHSTEDGKLYTYDLFAGDMKALLDHLHLDSVKIIGWSDGGNIGLIMAMKYPEKVGRLAVMGANVFIDETVVDKQIFRVLQYQKKEWKGDTSQRAVNALRLIHMLETEPRHTFEELQAIHCPVLVMAGQRDIVREEHTRQIAAHISGSQLKIFPGGTHAFPDENTDEFCKVTEAFFQSPPVEK